jgi:hypothetical protein
MRTIRWKSGYLLAKRKEKKNGDQHVLPFSQEVPAPRVTFVVQDLIKLRDIIYCM